MPRHCRAMAAREEAETVVEPGRKTLYPEGRGARRRKLDCQRDAIEATTDASDRGHNAAVRRKGWCGRAYPLDEQPNRAIAQKALIIQAIFGRHGQRRYRVHPFALCPQ